MASQYRGAGPFVLLVLLGLLGVLQAFVLVPPSQQLKQQQQQQQPAAATFGVSSRPRILLAAADGDGAKKRRWPVGRALRTFLQFNRPRLFQRRRGSGPAAPPEESAASMGEGLPLAHGVVLVTGATGGVGKRVVELLLRKGLRVRALARNKQKALAMLNKGQEPEKGARLEIVQADVSDARQLSAPVMEGVVAVVAATAAIVQPKAGDTVDRARYYQGIVFYEPETGALLLWNDQEQNPSEQLPPPLPAD